MSTSAPAINVNLKPCNRACNAIRDDGQHYSHCAAAPVLVPLPLDPWRSVTTTVRLGECTCGEAAARSYRQDIPSAHLPPCPARPIRVTCSIGGKDWASSEVTEVEVFHEGRETSPAELLRVCCDRLALIKAMVLGAPMAGEDTVEHLFAHRNAMFAAICEVARTEVANLEAQERLVNLLDPTRALFCPTPEQVRPSAQGLALYVKSLIEQVGDL